MSVGRVLLLGAGVGVASCGGSGAGTELAVSATTHNAVADEQPTAPSPGPESTVRQETESGANPATGGDEPVDFTNSVAFAVLATDIQPDSNRAVVHVVCDEPPPVIALVLRPWGAGIDPEARVDIEDPLPASDGSYVVEMLIPSWTTPGDKQIGVYCDRSLPNPTERFRLDGVDDVSTLLSADINPVWVESTVTGVGYCPTESDVDEVRVVIQPNLDTGAELVTIDVPTVVAQVAHDSENSADDELSAFSFEINLDGAMLAAIDEAENGDLLVAAFCQPVKEYRLVGVAAYEPYVIPVGR